MSKSVLQHHSKDACIPKRARGRSLRKQKLLWMLIHWCILSRTKKFSPMHIYGMGGHTPSLLPFCYMMRRASTEKWKPFWDNATRLLVTPWEDSPNSGKKRVFVVPQEETPQLRYNEPRWTTKILSLSRKKTDTVLVGHLQSCYRMQRVWCAP